MEIVEDWFKVKIKKDNKKDDNVNIENLKEENNFLKLKIKEMTEDIKRLVDEIKKKDERILKLSSKSKNCYICNNCNTYILKTNKNGRQYILDNGLKYLILDIDKDENMNYSEKKSYILKEDIVSIKELYCSECFIILGFKVTDIFNDWDYLFKNKLFLDERWYHFKIEEITE